MKITIPATKARKEFFQLIKAMEKPGSSATITVEGEAKVIMMSVEDFEGWMETLEIMSNPELVKEIREAQKEVEQGHTIPWEEIKKKFNL